ncbi:MAG TPA: patatin-like phospholipase family protein [Pirellulaceae bacterium]|jgi:NTE family protein|nr:patatin-like phospholipase family protein [Pirellulaceae bacterium]
MSDVQANETADETVDPRSTTRAIPSEGDVEAKPGERRGIALCLSGGGYRAALFHLGSLTRLNELGILSKIDTFSCVSGGSIFGGYLARKLSEGLPLKDGVYGEWDSLVEEFLAFTSRDIRTLAILAQLQFWRFEKGLGARRLEREYERLTKGMQLSELPNRPRFVFCSTDLVYANCWIADGNRVGDYLAGYVSPPPPEWTVARAVACSSCFPPIFAPMPTDLPASAFRRGKARRGPETTALIEKIRLTDGGVYDNLGVEPVWRTHEKLLVSDGGKPLTRVYVPAGRRLMRYSDVIQNQVNSLRVRWIIDIFERAKAGQRDAFDGTYWGVQSAVASYGADASRGYAKDTAANFIARIRTDLDAFSANEAWTLIKHGYELADVAIEKHVDALWPEEPPPVRVWPPRLSSDERVQKALKGSLERRYLPRLWTVPADDLLQT